MEIVMLALVALAVFAFAAVLFYAKVLDVRSEHVQPRRDGTRHRDRRWDA